MTEAAEKIMKEAALKITAKVRTEKPRILRVVVERGGTPPFVAAKRCKCGNSMVVRHADHWRAAGYCDVLFSTNAAVFEGCSRGSTPRRWHLVICDECGRGHYPRTFKDVTSAANISTTIT